MDDRLRETIGKAAACIHLKTRDFLAAPYFDKPAEAASRGASVTIVASGDSWSPLADLECVSYVPHEGTGSGPSAPHEVLLTLTADDGAAIIGALGQTCHGYAATNRTLIYVIRTMILHEIYLAEMGRAFGLAAHAAAGVDFQTLRARFRPGSHGVDVAEAP